MLFIMFHHVSSCFIMFHCCHMIHVRCSTYRFFYFNHQYVTNTWVITICLTAHPALPDGPRNSFYSWPPTLLFAPAPLQSSNEPVPVPKGRNVERLKNSHIHSKDCWESWYFSCFSDFQSYVNFENRVLGCIYSLWTKKYFQSDCPIDIPWTCRSWLLPLLSGFNLIYPTPICCGQKSWLFEQVYVVMGRRHLAWCPTFFVQVMV